MGGLSPAAPFVPPGSPGHVCPRTRGRLQPRTRSTLRRLHSAFSDEHACVRQGPLAGENRQNMHTKSRGLSGSSQGRGGREGPRRTRGSEHATRARLGSVQTAPGAGLRCQAGDAAKDAPAPAGCSTWKPKPTSFLFTLCGLQAYRVATHSWAGLPSVCWPACQSSAAPPTACFANR